MKYLDRMKLELDRIKERNEELNEDFADYDDNEQAEVSAPRTDVYESVFNALKAINNTKDWYYTKRLLIDLLEDKPLTEITDEDFFIDDVPYDREWLMSQGLRSRIECPRYYPLTRCETLEGKVYYTDVERYECFYTGCPEDKFKFSFLMGETLDRLFPIKMPYFPPEKPYRLEISEAKSKEPIRPDIGFDLVALWNIHTPEGEIMPINRFWRQGNNGMFEISYGDWERLSSDGRLLGGQKTQEETPAPTLN